MSHPLHQQEHPSSGLPAKELLPNSNHFAELPSFIFCSGELSPSQNRTLSAPSVKNKSPNDILYRLISFRISLKIICLAPGFHPSVPINTGESELSLSGLRPQNSLCSKYILQNSSVATLSSYITH
jgi:hypothetical protein